MWVSGIYKMEDRESAMKKIYYDPKTGFGSALELFRKVRDKGIKLREVKTWLEKQKTQQIYKKPKNRKAEMFKIESPRGSWQIDFTFAKNKRVNNGYHAIFVAVEIGSRLAFCKATKNLQEDAVKDCFRSLLKYANKHSVGLSYVITDAGSEFKSGTLRNWLEKHKIGHRILNPTFHYLANSIVERFNSTIKSKMMKYMSAYRTKKWIDHLPALVENYNNSVHAYHKETPFEVAQNPAIQLIHRLKTIDFNQKLKADPKFILSKIQKGSIVRLRKKDKGVFAKASANYHKKVGKVEGFEKNNTMVRVQGKSRLLRAWEVATIPQRVEKNPFARKIRSGDVETALERGRTSRRNGTHVKRKEIRNEPVLKENRQKKNQLRGIYKPGRKVSVVIGNAKVNAEVIKESVKGAWVKYLYKDGKTYDQDVAEDEIGEFDPKLALNLTLQEIRSKKPKRLESHKVVIDAEARDNIEMINKQKIFVINSEEEAFFLAKPVGKTRKAEIKDVKQSKGTIQRGTMLQVVKYFNKTKNEREYYLQKGNYYVDVASIEPVYDVGFEKAKKGVFLLSVKEEERILNEISRPEDVRCYVCNESEGDDFLLCDNPSCNRGGHAKCVGLDRIPDGDWFCNKCKKKHQHPPN